MTLAHRFHERCGCAALGAGPFTFAGNERQYERSRPFEVRHAFLDLALDFASKSVSGTTRLDIERVAPDAQTFDLDAIGFDVESVRLLENETSQPASYDYDGSTLQIEGLRGRARFSIEVRYRAVPRRGLYFLEPDDKVPDRPLQVWSQCQDEDARHWFPCQDKPHAKMTTELRIEVPRGFVALSNGEPLPVEASSKQKAKKTVFHFKLDKPHPSYLVTLVVGKFSVESDRDAELPDGRRVPIRYYVPVGREADIPRSLGETPRMIELFSKLTGVSFPWSRYSQVVVTDFIFGGMENTTATTMYEHVLLDRRAGLDAASHDLVAHELAHQWFGDFVTCRDWSHAWLNEGFATYFELLEREDRLGRDEYDHGVQADLEWYLAEAGSRYKRAMVCRDYQNPIDLFDRHLYQKGGLVLHMLRRELGDELFFRAIGVYLSGHAHGIVETTDLVRAFERVSGRSLERFFDQWVYRPGHPELKIKVSYDEGMVTVSLKQTQKPGDVAIFDFDFEIEIRNKQGDTSRHKRRVLGANDTLVVPLERRPEYVAFDPEFRVVASLSLEAPADMLRAQLETGSSALLRMRAAEALGKRQDPASISALARSLGAEGEPWMVRAEAARALGKTRAPEALAELQKQTSIAHPKVRRAVAAALGAFRSEQATRALLPLARKDPSYLVEAEAARSLGKTRQASALRPLLSMVDRPSWADVVRVGALDGLGALRDEAGLEAVLERTRYGYPTRGRRAALAALAELGEGKRVREHLEAMLEDKDPYVRIEVVTALVTLGDARAKGALRRTLDRDLDGRVTRRIREALRDWGEGPSERKRLTDELESVRSEFSELKARLAKLEAKNGEATPPKPTSQGGKVPKRKKKR